MSKVIAYYCHCGDILGPRGGHRRGCPLKRRPQIKEIVCKRLGVGHYVPEPVVDLVDQLVASGLSIRKITASVTGEMYAWGDTKE